MGWTVETLDRVVDKELRGLPQAHRQKLARIVELIEEHGPRDVGAPYVAALSGLWEIRVTAKGGISRAIFVTAKERRVVILRAFVKKTQATPKREIDIARRRAKDVK